MTPRPSYWQQLGDWLGPYREAWACMMLDIVAKCPSGTQLTRFSWHRGAIARERGVRLVAEEIDVKPLGVVDNSTSTTV